MGWGPGLDVVAQVAAEWWGLLLSVLPLCCITAGDLLGPDPMQVGSSPCTWRALPPPGPLATEAGSRDQPQVLTGLCETQPPLFTCCVIWPSGLTSMRPITFPLCIMGAVTLTTSGVRI